MPSQTLPAASLRPADRLPAARVWLRVATYSICRALSAIGTAISGVESDFLPALREASNRLRQRRSVDAGRLGRGAPEDPGAVLVGQAGARFGSTFGNRLIAVTLSAVSDPCPASVKSGLGSPGPSGRCHAKGRVTSHPLVRVPRSRRPTIRASRRRSRGCARQYGFPIRNRGPS
jgi:hypothetical protein